MRLHLSARVPNEGARRLAWWLGENTDRFPALIREVGMSEETIHRLISGELEPAAIMSYVISQATGGSVVSRDWRTAPRGWWFDRPTPRTYRPRVTGYDAAQETKQDRVGGRGYPLSRSSGVPAREGKALPALPRRGVA